ncbi:DUF4386 domain-containing protein [Desulfospira joergensenii]|uniref:DUF4386 domain-containing protein n=1 Tax=Desulfospira joergensenii TaxID=53329 RepID=UPI0003B31C2A|nr:DUF4386 domain-containing protein [Desulfospira joergensenii]
MKKSLKIPAVTYARITGLLYLAIIILGLYSEIFIRSNLISYGDADITAKNILSSQWLFRIGFACDLVVFICDVAVAFLLYVLLKPVNRSVSLISAGFRLTGTAIYGGNLLNYFAALLILSGTEYLSAFSPDQINAMALMFLNIHKHGYDLGLVFFGMHCLFMGFLLFKSGYFSRIVGILMVFAGIGYVVGSLTLFLSPRYSSVIVPIYIAPLIGELSLCLYLLIKSIKR